MAIINRDKSRPVIDISGPEGNAFALLGLAKNYARQLKYSEEEIEQLLSDMESDDYKHLVEVFEREFGKYCDLVVPRNWEFDDV